LKQAKKGAKFDELAKKILRKIRAPKTRRRSWLVIEKQTVPGVREGGVLATAGTVSDLVKTQYGFHSSRSLKKRLRTLSRLKK